MTEMVGREYGILDLIHIVEDDDTGEWGPMRMLLKAWVQAMADKLAADAGGTVEYAEIKEILLAVPDEDE